MRATNRLARWCWAACVLSAVGLCAQDVNFNTAIKLRMDTTTQSKDNLSKTGYGVGFEYKYALGAGWIAGEVGYFYKDGDPYIEPAGASSTGMNPVNTQLGGDSRRNQLEGYSLRLSYQAKLTGDWDWQGGLMIGGTKFRHQYVADIRSTGWGANGTSSTWRDTYQGTPEEGGFKPSPYAGVMWNLDPTSSLEFNLVLMNYTALNYVHKAGSGDYALNTQAGGRVTTNNAFPQDSLEKHSRLVPHLEIAYAFHF